MDDFRNKKLFDFGWTDPNKVQVGKATYDKSGEKWTSGPKQMDSSSVQSLVDKLRDLAATKFQDTGGGAPVLDLMVSSNSGKRVEKVSITKQGDTYFAKRENEPSIYVLDGKAVDDLQKAANDVKEFQPPSRKRSKRPCVNGLLTDLYELTMAAGYYEAGKTQQKATFELTVRRLPANRNFVIAAGLPQAIDYLQNLSYSSEEIDYLRDLPQFANVSTAFSNTCGASASRAMYSRYPKGHRYSPGSL